MVGSTHADSFDGICYEDALPLEFRPGPLPEAATLAGLNADNFQLLIADASLDEARVPASESKSDDDSTIAEDLHRLEHKVNVLIQLVAKLVAKDQLLPQPAAWRLYSAAIEWRSDGPDPAPGTTGQVLLYVSRQFPQPLRLPGRILASRSDDRGRWMRLSFDGLSVSVVEGLDRLIFRHHRRAVAGVRTIPKE